MEFVGWLSSLLPHLFHSALSLPPSPLLSSEDRHSSWSQRTGPFPSHLQSPWLLRSPATQTTVLWRV